MSRIVVHLSIFTPLNLPEDFHQDPHTHQHLCCGEKTPSVGNIYYVLLYASDLAEVSCERCLDSDVYRNFVLQLELTR